MELTPIQKAEIRLKSIEIAMKTGTRVNMEKDACLEMAQKIYKFTVGATESKKPVVGRKRKSQKVSKKRNPGNLV